MFSYIVSFVVGIVCIILGISNMKGNISSLHFYHRNRVLDEDILPFGKKVGLGAIICGSAIVIFSAIMVVTLFIKSRVLTFIGDGVLTLGLAIGLVISLYAIKKYNKGIF